MLRSLPIPATLFFALAAMLWWEPRNAAAQNAPPSPPRTDVVTYGDHPLNLYRGSVIMVDLDGADRMDLVMTGSLSPPEFDEEIPRTYFGVLRHHTELRAVDPFVFDSIRSFVMIPAPNPAGFFETHLSVTDFNNDGRPDIGLAGLRRQERIGVPSTMLIENRQGLQLAVRETGLPPVQSGALDWGDFDNDGKADLLLTGKTPEGFATRIYRNLGTGAFEETGIDLPGIAHGQGVWGDSDNDGDLDILLTGSRSGGSFLSALYLNVDGSFVESGANLTGLAFSHARWIDLNHDGLLDIMLSGAYQSPFILSGGLFIYRNEGNNSFRLVPNDLDFHFDGDFDLLDWDSDGDTDILASGHEEATGSRPARFYLNENGRFSMYHEVIHYEDMSFAPGDFDRDGDVDLFATGFNPEALGLVTPTATFWIKWGHFSNAAPTPPANLSSTVDGGQVELNWSAATDDKTVSPALTYNVRVGTRPGGVDVMSPLSHPETGTRYVCAPGNVFHNLRWPLRSLPPGTYYWSVQAVDQSCVGSSFSPERTFVVTGTSESLNAGNDELPSILSIQPAHPNPFGDRTTLRYTLQNALEVELGIFDVLGRRVRTLASGLIPAGSHAAVWDGHDDRGMPTASGVYVYRLRSNRRAISGTVILTR